MKIADDGVLQVTVPMPFALREVHVYALDTGAGWILIDSGFPSEAARAQLAAELEQVVGGLSRIALIILTHFHPDHSGLAGWLQQRSGCPVVIHEADWPRLRGMHSPDLAGERFFSPVAQRSGVTLDHVRELIGQVRVPLEMPTIVSGGETFSIGGRDLDLVWTPGHTEGHLCVLDRPTGVLFTGDHLLARITPHVGRLHAAGRNPLHDFEDSLALIERMAPRRALPAHEGPVEDVAARCREIAAHHQTRRQQILTAVRSQPRTAPELAEALLRGRRDEMQRMLALTETEAHLDALVDERLLVRVQDDEAAEPSYEFQA